MLTPVGDVLLCCTRAEPLAARPSACRGRCCSAALTTLASPPQRHCTVTLSYTPELVVYQEAQACILMDDKH